MEGRFGARPILTIFDTPFALDNEISDARVDGMPVLAPWKDED